MKSKRVFLYHWKGKIFEITPSYVFVFIVCSIESLLIHANSKLLVLNLLLNICLESL